MNQHSRFLIFLFFWLLLNLFTAAFTELYSDEAYYWMYSQFLDWGYFDHPPMIAVMIKMGEWLGKTELAVRMVNVFVVTAGIYMLYRFVKPNNTLIFSLTLFGFLILHITGFVSVPDGPFFFFNLIYLYVFHRLTENNNLKNQLLVGLFAALMIYSKYHGCLVILLCIGGYPKILKHYGIYLAGAVAFVLLLPHFYWQYSHDFPSLSYHLVQRSSSDYRIGKTLEYVFGNIPFHGGLIALTLFIATFFYKSTSTWERILKWNLYGTFLFFFFVTFKGQFIEANWTLPAVLPLIYFGYKQVEQSKHFPKYKVLVWVFLPIMLFLRIHLVFPFFKVNKDRVWDFHDGVQFAEKVDKIANGKRIVANRYQDASHLNFYLDKDYIIPALNIQSRANQYSIWKFEEKQACKADVVYVNNHLEGVEVPRKFKKRIVSTIDNALFPNCVKLLVNQVSLNGNTITADLNVSLPESFTESERMEYHVYYQVYSNEDELLLEKDFPLNIIMLGDTQVKLDIQLADISKAKQVEFRIGVPKMGGYNNQVLVHKLVD